MINVPDAELHIVGPKTSQSGIDDITIPERTYFHGELKGDALDNMYKSASVFVLPSIEEGMALVQAEALASGLPIIATHNTGGENLFRPGVGGYRVPIRDAYSIANHLSVLAQDPGLLNEMRRGARESASRFEDWSSSAKRLQSTLLQAIRR